MAEAKKIQRDREAQQTQLNAGVVSAKAWRVRALGGTQTGWAWDVFGVKFLDADGTWLNEGSPIYSGSVSDPENGGVKGYEPENVLFRPGQGGLWGGRQNAKKQFS